MMRKRGIRLIEGSTPEQRAEQEILELWNKLDFHILRRDRASLPANVMWQREQALKTFNKERARIIAKHGVIHIFGQVLRSWIEDLKWQLGEKKALLRCLQSVCKHPRKKNYTCLDCGKVIPRPRRFK